MRFSQKKKLIDQDLSGEKILITVGGTREAIDPVRFISNSSSGKMGFALAAAAFERGADVTIVKGVTTADPPQNVKTVPVRSAQEMYDSTIAEMAGSTIFIGAAAVADYRPKRSSDIKIKKDGNEDLNLELERTQDILASVSKNRHEGLLVVGFAAETNDTVENAKAKMQKKDLDMIIANDITKTGAGFNSDTNIATILTRTGDTKIELPLIKKSELANRIFDEIVKLRNQIRL